MHIYFFPLSYAFTYTLGQIVWYDNCVKSFTFHSIYRFPFLMQPYATSNLCSFCSFTLFMLLFRIAPLFRAVSYNSITLVLNYILRLTCRLCYSILYLAFSTALSSSSSCRFSTSLARCRYAFTLPVGIPMTSAISLIFIP